MAITAAVELISIGSVYPLMSSALLSQDNIIFEQNNFFSYLKSIDISIIIYTVIIIFIFRFALTVLSTWYQSYIGEKMIINLSMEIFTGYLIKNPKVLQGQKIGDLIRMVSGSVNQVINSYFLQIIVIFFEFLTLFIIFITIILLLGLFQVSLAIMVILLVIFLFRSINIYLIELGKIKKISESNKMELINDSYHLNKEIRNFNLSKNFKEKFLKAANDSARVSIRNQVFAILPRNVFEILIILFSMIYLLFIIKSNINFLNQLPILGTIMFAFLRTLPSLNKIMQGYQRLNYSKTFLDEIMYEITSLNEIKKSKNTSKESKNNFDSITFKNVSVNFKSEILGPWSFTIRKGEWIFLSGPSGSGKSTILDIISGHQEFDGEIIIDNKSYKSSIQNQIHDIGYVPQKVHLIKDRLRENIRLYNSSLTKTKNIDKIINSVSLKDLEFILKNNFEADTISGGQRQRVGIARALLINPQLLILDESTSALDDHLEENILKTIKNMTTEITVIMTTHSSKFKNYFDREIIIK